MPKFSSKLRRRQLDTMLSHYRGLPELPRGYVKEIREALGMSSYQLADALGIGQSSAIEMEQSEQLGTISLNTLRRAGAALGCKLVYALVPETQLDKVVTQQAKKQAEHLAKGIFRTMALEKQSTTSSDHELLISELAEEILRKGGRNLWKKYEQETKSLEN